MMTIKRKIGAIFGRKGTESGGLDFEPRWHLKDGWEKKVASPVVKYPLGPVAAYEILDLIGRLARAGVSIEVMAQALAGLAQQEQKTLVETGTKTVYSGKTVGKADPTIWALHDAEVEIGGFASVWAEDSATVVARDNARVVAWCSAKVTAYDDAIVEASFGVKVVAHGNVTVIATDEVDVELHDKARRIPNVNPFYIR
jgi:hypothetical protein